MSDTNAKIYNWLDIQPVRARTGFVQTEKCSQFRGVYRILLGGSRSLTPRIDANYTTERYASRANAATNRIAPYALVNARLTWRNGRGDWEASLEATNLANKYYFLTRFDQYSSTGVTTGQPGRPREFALTIKKKFGK